MRAFKSATFIEQIIGRGLRLPFGKYTPKEALNTLEIIMHDNFQELLNVRKSLKENFFGFREKTENREGNRASGFDNYDFQSPSPIEKDSDFPPNDFTPPRFR